MLHLHMDGHKFLALRRMYHTSLDRPKNPPQF